MARRFFFTSYAVFFLPQFSTRITFPPSRRTIPRTRSTILSTRSSARSGRTRKMVSYSRSRAPAPGPPLACVSCCCICRLSGLPLSRRGGTSVTVFCLCLAAFFRTAVELVHGRAWALEERGHRGVGRLRHQLAELGFLLRRELRQHPVGAFPGRRRLADAEPHPPLAVPGAPVE